MKTVAARSISSRKESTDEDKVSSWTWDTSQLLLRVGRRVLELLDPRERPLDNRFVLLTSVCRRGFEDYVLEETGLHRLVMGRIGSVPKTSLTQGRTELTIARASWWIETHPRRSR